MTLREKAEAVNVSASDGFRHCWSVAGTVRCPAAFSRATAATTRADREGERGPVPIARAARAVRGACAGRPLLDDFLAKPSSLTCPARTCALPGCGATFVPAPKRGNPRMYCSTKCRNTANSGRAARGRSGRRHGTAAAKPASLWSLPGLDSASSARDLPVAAEGDAPGEGRDQGGGHGEGAAGARQVLDHGIIGCFAANLTVRAAGEEEGPGFGGAGRAGPRQSTIWAGVPLKVTPAAFWPIRGHCRI